MEKFALLNLLKVLGSLNAQPSAESEKAPPAPAPAAPVQSAQPATAETNAYPNVMASVLERHEYIANRIRNKS